ncbi:MAG: SAF domain-containing protein [Anaerolineales bacterium]|nr:SAF domain-containing protein [Anaerolineales bacterium]
MRRGRVLIMVLLIVIIGLVVAYFAFSSLFAPSGSDQPVSTDIEIYMAGQSIPQGTEITEEVLKTMSIPQGAFVDVEYRVDELNLLLGKVAKYPIDQGVPITESMVGDGSAGIAISGPQWAALIPAGQTAISIPTDRLGLVGYGVGDGAHVNINACFLFVDVDPSFQTILPNKFITLTGTGFTGEGGLPIITLGNTGPADAVAAPAQGRLELEPAIQQPYYLVPSEAQRPRLVCQIVLQDVVVLKVGDFVATPATTDPNAPADQAQATETQSQSTTPDIVTLLVPPQDSITLSYLINTNAKLSLTVRNPIDQARQATEASTLQFLLSQYNIPVPAKLPYSLQPPILTLSGPALPTNIAPAQ